MGSPGVLIVHEGGQTGVAFLIAKPYGFSLDSATYPIVLCPNWLRQLQWRTHVDAPAVYNDAIEAIVARVVWWRDAGPLDIDDDSIWGEGCCVALTKAGLAQFTATQGKVIINAFASERFRSRASTAKNSSKRSRIAIQSDLPTCLRRTVDVEDLDHCWSGRGESEFSNIGLEYLWTRKCGKSALLPC